VVTVILAALALAPAHPARGDLLETFSGTGPFAASPAGPVGFDNSGWLVNGLPGVFAVNSQGEQVYRQTTSPVGQDALNRFTGSHAFSAVVEVSNPSIADSFSGIRLGILDSAFDTMLVVIQPRSGRMVAELQANLASGAFMSGGTLDLGAAGSVDQVTVQFDFAPDLVNGGGMFSALADVNEQGLFQSVGTVDGSFYTLSPSALRQFSLNTFSVGSFPVSADFDRFQINSVPEPAAAAFGILATLGLVARVRRRQR
jgi:hypothetical protein